MGFSGGGFARRCIVMVDKRLTKREIDLGVFVSSPPLCTLPSHYVGFLQWLSLALQSGFRSWLPVPCFSGLGQRLPVRIRTGCVCRSSQGNARGVNSSRRTTLTAQRNRRHPSTRRRPSAHRPKPLPPPAARAGGCPARRRRRRAARTGRRLSARLATSRPLATLVASVVDPNSCWLVGRLPDVVGLAA